MKGQAAIEFLMTYGWALLIIFTVLALLIASGVWQRPAPTECFVHPDLPCKGAAVTCDDGGNCEFLLVFSNNQGGNISNVGFSGSPSIIEGPQPMTAMGTLLPAPVDSTTYQQGELIELDFPTVSNHWELGDVIGENIKIKFTIKYMDDLGIEHETSGHVRTTIIPQ